MSGNAELSLIEFKYRTECHRLNKSLCFRVDQHVDEESIMSTSSRSIFEMVEQMVFGQ